MNRVSLAFLCLCFLVVGACGDSSSGLSGTAAPAGSPACDALRACCTSMADPTQCKSLVDSFESSSNANDLCTNVLNSYIATGQCTGGAGGSSGAGGAGGAGAGHGAAAGTGTGGLGGNQGGAAGNGGAGGTPGCPTGYSLCGSACVNTSQDTAHCGTCDKACTPGDVCDAGQCTTIEDCTVKPCVGLTYCDLATKKCKAGCVNESQCGNSETCEPTTRQCVCKSGYERCEGLCTSTTSPADLPCAGGFYCDFSSGHCAQGCAFDTQCSAQQHCQSHACVCDANYHLCSGSCVANSSVDHCGTSCSACTVPAHATASCNAGQCGYQCVGGYHDCSGSCVQNSNPQNCGTSCSPCTAPANATATCNGSSCGFTCNAGYVPCPAGCCENCATAGCTGFTWCDDTTGLCQPGCTHHAQCGDGYFCCHAQHECVVTVDTSCPAGYSYLGMCSNGVDFCVSGCLPDGTTYPFVDPCPAGTTERGDWYCSDITRICVPND